MDDSGEGEKVVPLFEIRSPNSRPRKQLFDVSG
jgi:hypothetical protein